MARFTLNYTGADASSAKLDFYDASRALIGFQRSLALTTHLALNGEIITQAPSLDHARIYVEPPQAGSWEVVATIVTGAIGGAMIAPKDSVLGHFTRSLYDYVLNSTLGIDVDFDKMIRQQHRELCDEKKITEHKLDSLIEKTEPAIVDMHRPFIWSQTARRARISFGDSGDNRVGPAMDPETYEYATRTVKVKLPVEINGIISSYNSNTYKGRVFLMDEQRPVPFQLSDECRDRATVNSITNSLSINATDRSNRAAEIALRAFRRESSAGRLKSLWIVGVASTIDELF